MWQLHNRIRMFRVHNCAKRKKAATTGQSSGGQETLRLRRLPLARSARGKEGGRPLGCFFYDLQEFPT